MKNRLKIILPLGVVYGLILVWIRIRLDLTDREMWYIYIGMSVILLLGAVGANLIWQWQFIKKLKALEMILRIEQDAERFILENKALLSRVRSQSHQSLLKLNLSAGYCEMGDYEAAEAILKELSIKQLKGAQRVVYGINLNYCLFKQNRNNEALSIFEDMRSEYALFESHPQLGGSIAVLKIYVELAEGNMDSARALLDISRKTWQAAHFQDDWSYFVKLLA